MRVSRRAASAVLIALLMLGGGRAALADIHTSTGTNVQEGDNSGSSDQKGDANSGDAVTGQVVGGVVSGDAHVDATNRSVDSKAESGDADGSNDASGFAGLEVEPAPSCGVAEGDVAAADCPETQDVGFIGQEADILGSTSAFNIQEGDNDQSIDQKSDASSGDALAGSQVVGSIGGRTDIVVSNDGENTDVESGDASFDNHIGSSETGQTIDFIGLPCCPIPGVAAHKNINTAILLVLLAGIMYSRRRRSVVSTRDE